MRPGGQDGDAVDSEGGGEDPVPDPEAKVRKQSWWDCDGAVSSLLGKWVGWHASAKSAMTRDLHKPQKLLKHEFLNR